MPAINSFGGVSSLRFGWKVRTGTDLYWMVQINLKCTFLAV